MLPRKRGSPTIAKRERLPDGGHFRLAGRDLLANRGDMPPQTAIGPPRTARSPSLAAPPPRAHGRRTPILRQYRDIWTQRETPEGKSAGLALGHLIIASNPPLPARSGRTSRQAHRHGSSTSSHGPSGGRRARRRRRRRRTGPRPRSRCRQGRGQPPRGRPRRSPPRCRC